MTTNKHSLNDGGPAFPCEVDSTQPLHRQVGNTVWQTYGMTLRDYFAAKAMQALAAQALPLKHETGFGINDRRAHVASAAYAMADAMLKARQS